MAYYDELYKEFILNQLSGKGNIPALNEQSLIEAYTPRPFNLGFPQGNISGVNPYTGKSYSATQPEYSTRTVTTPFPYGFNKNLGITQQPKWSPGVQHSGMPVDEPTGIFGKSNLSGLIGDNKMAAALIALRGLEAGSRGQNIFQAAAPAAMGGLSDAFIIEKYKDIKKKTKAKDKIQKSKLFTDREKLTIEAFGKLAPSKTTATMKNFNFFKNMPKTEENLRIADMVLKRKTKDEFMAGIYTAQAKDTTSSNQEKDEQAKYFLDKWDDMKNQINLEVETISDVSTGNELIKNFKGNAKQVEQLSILYNHPNNKNIPVEELIEYVKQNY
jgi:hypothetical protein